MSPTFGSSLADTDVIMKVHVKIIRRIAVKHKKDIKYDKSQYHK